MILWCKRYVLILSILSCHVCICLLLSAPEGKLEMSDVILLSGISGLSFDSPVSSLVFSVWSSCSFCLVIFLLMVHSPDFFPENSNIPTLCIYITFFNFVLCLSIPFFYFSLTWYWWMEWSTKPAYPSLMCSFNRGNTEGTNSSEICVWCLCMYVSCLWSDWFCRLTWQRVDIYARRV